jgi:tellurite resistance protein TerC
MEETSGSDAYRPPEELVSVSVPLWIWATTLVVLFAVFALDLLVTDRHRVSLREAGLWVAGAAVLAVLFGLGVAKIAGPAFGGQFFAGWITEYSLSVDNLFVFVIIMSRFRVPEEYRDRALKLGVLLALGLRGIFIGLGAAAVSRFDWTFYVFGAFLIATAAKLATGHDGPAGAGGRRENCLVRLARRLYPTTGAYHGTALTARVGGRRVLTPMSLVILALGATDLLFAFDSIPAVFGLTREPYIVFAANAFALLGLRRLYFLIGGLLDRLVHLSTGLSLILGFIGLKMILEALHGSGVDHLGPLPIPVVPTSVSLGVIVAILAVVTAASLTTGDARRRRNHTLL